MAKGTILKELKETIYNVMDENGNFRVLPIGELDKRKLSEPRLQLLRNIVDLVLNTNIVCDETKMYIRDRNIKYNQVTEKLNEQPVNKKNPISYNSTVSKIQYDKKKLEAYLGYTIMSDIIVTNKSIEGYVVKVSELMGKFNDESKLRDNLLLNIEKGTIVTEFDDSNGTFGEVFNSTIIGYIKDRVDKVEKELNANKEFVGYFNYLLSGMHTTDENVKRDRENLVGLLKGVNWSDEDDNKHSKFEDDYEEEDAIQENNYSNIGEPIDLNEL